MSIDRRLVLSLFIAAEPSNHNTPPLSYSYACVGGVCKPCAAGEVDCACGAGNACNALVAMPNKVAQCVTGRCIVVDVMQQKGCLNCPCDTGDKCDTADLECKQGQCQPMPAPTCTPGADVGCACAAGECNAPLKCISAVCRMVQTTYTLATRPPTAPPTSATQSTCSCTSGTCPMGKISVKSATADSCGCYATECVDGPKSASGAATVFVSFAAALVVLVASMMQ